MQGAMLKQMLTMFGVDPEEITKQITQFATFAQQAAETTARIETKLDNLTARMDAMDAEMRRRYGPVAPPRIIEG